MNAAEFIEMMHRGQKRKTGDPYVSHLYAVRDILQKAGVTQSYMLDAALLHDVLEDTNVTAEFIELHFGEHIAEIVAHLSKMSGWLTEYSKAHTVANSLKGNSAKYPEVLLLKAADRLHNLQTIEGFSPEKQVSYLAETVDVLIPSIESSIGNPLQEQFTPILKVLLEQLQNEVQSVKDTLQSPS